METEHHIWQFAWDVFNNWAGYFTGGCIMAVITFWHSWRDKTMKRKVLLGITVLFFAMGAYKAWEEQYEKAESASNSNDAALHQTHEYESRNNVLTAALIARTNAQQLPIPINVFSSQFSPDDQAAIADFQETYRNADYHRPELLLRLRDFENNSTNAAVKKFEAERIKTFLDKIETNAAQEMVNIHAAGTTNGEFRALALYYVNVRGWRCHIFTDYR